MEDENAVSLGKQGSELQIVVAFEVEQINLHASQTTCPSILVYDDKAPSWLCR
jgi:hypothetical protein